MRNADVRRACLALIHHRLSDSPDGDPQPVALGWQLENGRASANAMAALCGGALAGARRVRWTPSLALQDLLNEYGVVRLERDPAGSPRRRAGRQRVADALH